jgi:formamidopyrimidine-DNA glycosylase
MPELPEAETIARELHRRLRGLTLGRVVVARTDVVHGDPRPLSRLLPRRRVRRVHRRAKRVILDLAPTAQVVFHLGMSGRLTITDRNEPVESHTHLCIAVAGQPIELRFRDPRRFGGVWCFAGGDDHVGKTLGALGVEPLEATPASFCNLLSRRRQIKALLLDQRVIAGMGNIYCDESLHAAGIHPFTRADLLDVDDSARLLRAIKSTLRSAIRSNGTTLMDYRRADGSEGSFRKRHRVYGRTGEPCRTCKTPITRILAAGRSTHLCETCQVWIR